MQLLAREASRLWSRIASIAGITDEGELTGSLAGKEFPVVSDARGEEMREAIAAAREAGDSVGGVIECAILGAPRALATDVWRHGKSHRRGCFRHSRGPRASSSARALAWRAFAAARITTPLRSKTARSSLRRTIAAAFSAVSRTACPRVPRGVQADAIHRTRAAERQFATMVPEKMAVTAATNPCIVPRAVPCVEAAAASAV